jgi:MFS family permease
VLSRLTASLRALGQALRNRGLRRVLAAWTLAILGDNAVVVALAVLSYRSGGAAGVGIMGALRTLLPAVVAPFASTLADRYRRERVLALSIVVRAAMMAGMAVAASASAPIGILYALAALAACTSTATRPAQAAIVPVLARTPEELTAANVATTTVEGAAYFVGPAIGGVVLALTGATATFLAGTALLVAAAVVVAGVRTAAPAGVAEEGGGIVAEAVAGARAIAADSHMRFVVGLYSLQTMVAGTMNVLEVVIAIRVLHLGNAGVGWVIAVQGVGGILGSAGALSLAGSPRLGRAFAVGVAAWGAPLAVIGFVPVTGAAVVALGVIGFANTVVDAAAVTLIQRRAGDAVIGRVFGAVESAIVGGLGAGSLLAPLIVTQLGSRPALIAIGLFLPVVVAVTWRATAALDAEPAPSAGRVAVLEAVPLFAGLGPSVLEQLASDLEPRRLAAGEVVFRQGDPGDRFYVVAEGRFSVAVDGTAAAELGPGEFFGEIALLHDTPRTGTVTAETDGAVYALAREPFVGALAGHAATAAEMAAVAAARLGHLRPRTLL